MSNKKFLKKQAKLLIKNYLKSYLDKYGFNLKENISYVVRFDNQHIYQIKDESPEGKVVFSVYFNHFNNSFGIKMKLNAIERDYICLLMNEFKEILKREVKSGSEIFEFKVFDLNYFKEKINQIKINNKLKLNEVEIKKDFLNYVDLEFKKENYNELNYNDFYHYIVLDYLE